MVAWQMFVLIGTLGGVLAGLFGVGGGIHCPSVTSLYSFGSWESISSMALSTEWVGCNYLLIADQ